MFINIVIYVMYCCTSSFKKNCDIGVFFIQSELEDAQEKYRSIKVTLDNAYRSLQHSREIYICLHVFCSGSRIANSFMALKLISSIISLHNLLAAG